MRTDLKPYKMGDFLSVKHGFAFLGEFFASHGTYIVLTPGNFVESGGFKRVIGKEKFYTIDFPEEYLCSFGDLVVAMTEQAEGLLGSTAIIPESGIYLHNQRIGLITWNEEVVDKYYLYYLFMTNSVRKQIRDTASGTKVKHTSPERIYDVDVFLPDTRVQRKNATLLWAIDQKIGLNSRIIVELEKMAKTIYNYWFVQFDFPNVEGLPYRSSGGAMEWNTLVKREIPKGWEIGNLYDIADYVNGLACQNFRPKEGEEFLPVIKIKEMHEGINKDTEQVSTNIPDKNKIENGDILFSWSATLEVMYWVGGDAGLNQHIFKIVPRNFYSKEYVYHQLTTYVINFVKMAKARRTTMGHITSDHLSQSQIVLPPKSVIDTFNLRVSPMHKKILTCSRENQELTKLRNWLLPMLMNGQITVE